MWPFEPIILYGQFGIVVNPVEVLPVLRELTEAEPFWQAVEVVRFAGFDGSSTGDSYIDIQTFIATFDVS